MKFTMQYSVGGGVADVPQDDIKEFNELARQNGETPEPVFSYRIKDGSGTHDVEVPKSQYGEFEKLATENGAKIEPLRRFTTNDGKEWLLGMEEMHSFFNDPTSPYFKERPLIDPVGDPSSYPESSGKDQSSQEELEKALEANARLEAERSAAPGQAPQAPAQRADYPVDYDSTDQFAEYHRKKGEEDSRRITHVAGEILRGMFTTAGMKEVAEEHASARPLAYISDLCNSFVAGLLGGFAKISEGTGALVQSVGETTGSDVVKDFGKWTREGAQADQRMLQENLRTDTLDTKGGGAVSKVLDVGKGVAGVTGEFLPAAIPGAGQAYAATLVSAGSVNRYANVFDEAIYNGVDPKTAEGLAFAGAGIDALGNMLLMGKFRGIWSGEQKALADAAKRGVVRRIVGETVKTGAIMSGMGMGGEIIDEGAQGAQDPDWSKVAKVGFDQFIEGGLFHLVNSGAHSATHIGWGRDVKGIPSGAARDMLANPEGRALIFCNSPEAAAEIFRARRKGENVSRKMIRDLGISEDVATTVADRNAIGDRLMADYDAFKARVRTRMDDVQAVALSNEIAFRMKGGYEDTAYEEVWTKAVEQIKDAREIDDPERRAQIVSEAMKEVLSESQKTSPNEGGEEPAPGNQTGGEPPKKPNPPESRESKPVEPSAGPGTGDDTPEAPKPPEGGESRSVTSVRVGDVKPGESFTYEGKELYKNEQGEIVEVDVGKDGKRVERPTKRHFTGEELVDIPDAEASAEVKPVEPSTGGGEEAHAPVLSGDEVRKTMPGYDPKNWKTHVDRNGYVAPRMEKQFQELLSTRKGKGNGEVIFLAGGNGSGKSTLVSGLGSTPDFIIDSTLGNLKTAKKQIDAVLANGQKPVIDYVYRAPEEALEGVIERVENGGHVVSPLSFADSHTKGIKNLRLLADEYGDKISIHVIDNSAEGSPEITLEQLEAKGIPDHAEIRKRANEVLGQYGALVGDGGAKGTSGGGGEVKGAKAQEGDGAAGADGLKGRADGGAPQGKGGAADPRVKRPSIFFVKDKEGVPITPVVKATRDLIKAQSDLYKVRFSPASKKRVEQEYASYNEKVDAFKKVIADPSVSIEDLKAEAARFDAEEEGFSPDNVSFTQHHYWAISNAIRAEIARREGRPKPLLRNEFYPQGARTKLLPLQKDEYEARAGAIASGKPENVDGLGEVIVHKDDGKWYVLNKDVGIAIGSGKDRADAIANAKSRMSALDPDEVSARLERLREQFDEAKAKYGAQQAEAPKPKKQSQSAQTRRDDVKRLTGIDFDETSLSDKDLMRFRKLYQDYSKGGDEAKSGAAAEALKKFVAEHEQKIKDLSVESTKEVRVKDGAANARRFNEGDKVSFIEELATMARRRNVSRVDATIAITPTKQRPDKVMVSDGKQRWVVDADLLKTPEEMDAFLAGRKNAAEGPKPEVTAETPAEAPAKPAEAPAPAAAPASESPKKDLKTAVRELEKLRDRRASLKGTQFTGEDAQKNREENERSIAELDRRIEAAEAGLDDLREPSKPIPPAENLKPNPKKAAKVVADFASKDDTRKTLKAPYHDKKNGVVVATDGRILIATKHGFDPNAKEPEDGYPNWTHVVPDEKNLTVSIKVNPAELQKVCKDAIRLSRAVGIKDDGQHNTTPNVVLRHGDGTYTILSAEYLLTVAKAMEANGLTELRAAPTKKGTIGHTPLMARNADTTILIMPLRGGSYESVGRVSSNLVFDGMTGRIIRAPERTDMGVMRDTKMSEEWLTTLRESVVRERKRAEAEARNLDIFEVITGAWKNGEKDPRVAYKRFNNETDFDSLSPENQKAFVDLLNAGSEEELARQIAEYVARRMPDAAANLWVDKDPKQIAKIEKRIAAEDEVESRLMRDDEARALFGLEPRKKAAKDASAKDAEEGERLKKESDEAEANIEKVNTEVGDLISKHLLAQGTAKNNADGRAMKAKAKSALIDRLSSLTDEEFDSVKQSFKQTMRDNGEDMDKVGEIQAIFNAETAKRNAKSAKKPKAEEPAKPVEEMPAPAEDKRTLRELAEESVSMLRDEKFDEHEAVRGAFREKLKTATDAELKELHAEMKKKADKSSGEEKLRYTGIASELNHEINSRFAGKGKGKKPNESGEEKIIGQTRDGESVRIVQNGRVYEVELPDVKFPKTFTRATSKADWEAKMKEMGELQRELKAKAPFHSVINPKTGKYYANDSEIARRRQREIAAYNEAVQRAANQAMEQIGEYDESWDSVKRSPRAQETQEAWDEGKQNLSSSPNAKVVKSGKSQSDSIVYSPPDGTTPFRVNKKSISHGIRGVDPSDNVTVGRHIGEALDASQELPEHTADARYRMAAVKIGGADAHVLFTIEKRSGTVTQIDVLKSLNTKRAAQKGSTLTSTNSGMGARPFETAKESIAELESAWKSQFRDGIEAHNKARGRDATFIRDGEPAKMPAMSEATRKELAKVRTELDGESGDNVVPEWMDKLTDAEAKEYIDLIKKAHADPSMDDARIDWEVKKQAEIEQREAGEPERLKVKGRPHALSTMHGNGNSSSLDTIKNRAEKGVLPDSITEMPEGIGISRPGRFGAKDPAVLFHYAEDGDSIGHPLFGDTKEIMSWVREQGLDRKSVKVTQEDSAGSTEKPVREGGKDETRPVPTRHDSGRYSESRPEGSVPQDESAGKLARKSRATAAVEEVANALTAKDFDAGKQAMERLRKSIDDGEAFPDKETVAKLAENVPPELRKSFVDNMDKWREHAESSDEAPDAEDAGRSEVLDRASKGVRPTGFHEADDGVHFEYGDKDVVVDGDAEDVLKWARDKKVFKAEVDAEKKAAAEAFNAEAFEIGSDGKKKPIARGTKETMDAYRRLGITAGLPDADLRKELRRCEAHSSDPRFAQRAKDIKAVLEYRKATENLPPKEGGSYAGTADDDIREMAVLDVTGKKVAFLDNVADMANVHWNDPESIKQYLLGHIGERFSTIATGEAIELGDELPDEYSRSNSAEAERRNIKRLAKARAKLATGLGDAIQSAEASTAEPARDKEREGGVYYRRPVTFALRGGDGQIKVYDADLLTYKVNGVEQLYDAVHLRDNTTPGIAGAVEQTVSNVRPSRTTEASALPSHNAVSARESIPQSSAGGKPKSDMAVAYEATKALSNFIPGVKVVVEKDGAKPDSSATPIRSKAGTVVGTWNRKTKTLTLKRGATLETVAHELGGHALWQYAEQHPELGLKATLEAWANDAPPELVDAIKKAYPNITGEKLMEEIFAHRFGMEKSGKIAEALKTREGRKWYQKVWDSIKGAWRSMAARLGGNRIDLNAIEDMTPDEAVDFIADQLVRGKTLGKLNMSRPEDVEVEREMRRVNPAPTDLMRGSRWTRDWYMRNMADRFHDVLSLERDLIAASGVGIDAKDSAYHALRVSSGRKEAKRREIQHIYDRVEKLFNDNRGNITSEDVHKFLLAQAAPERNAKILRRSNGAKTEGAGMSDADAAQIMADLTTAGKLPVLQEFEAVRKELSDRYGVDYLADNGIIDRETADRLKAEEPHYVPMRDDYTDENGFDLNSSRRLELPPLKTAHGRSDMADHPLAFLFMQAADNVARVEANIVRQKLARIVQRNNSLGVGRVRGQRIVPDYDVATGNTAMVIDKLDTERENPNIIVFRENGKKKVIEFNGPRGALIVQAVRGEGINRGPEFLQKMSRMWAATATQYSPLGFKTNNAIKDSTEVLMNISEDEGVGTGAKFLALRASAVANGYASTMRDYIRTGDFSGRKGTRLREFVENGGLIGGGVREGYQELEQRFEDAAKVISRIDRAKNKPLAMLEAMRDKISFSNEMTENLSRFINYDVRRSAGESIEEAIIASREDSTDFNMYGNQRWINNVRVFSNSILGGTMRATRQMAKHPIKTAEILISLGIIEELADAAINYDDDEREQEGLGTGDDISEYERSQTMRLRVGGKYARVPFHLGPFSLLKYVGNNAGRAILGKIGWAEAMENVAKEAATVGSHFSGWGEVSVGEEGPSFMNSAFPTLGQPFVQVALNENFMGGQIRKEHNFPGMKDLPDSSFSKPQTGEGWEQFAKLVNRIGGGDEFRKAYFTWLDNAPEDYKYAFEQVFKNTGKDVLQTWDTSKRAVESAATGENKMVLNDVPVVNKVFRSVPQNDSRYYRSLHAYSKAMQEWSKTPKTSRMHEIESEIPGIGCLDGLAANITAMRKRELETTDEREKESLAAQRRKEQAKFIRIMSGKDRSHDADFRRQRIVKAADELTKHEIGRLNKEEKSKLMRILEGVPYDEIRSALEAYYSEDVEVKGSDGYETRQRLKDRTIDKRIERLQMLFRD